VRGKCWANGSIRLTMRIDQDYLMQLMEFFESSRRPTITIQDFDTAGLMEGEDKFIFHMEILND
jgi:hypothetical protein